MLRPQAGGGPGSTGDPGSWPAEAADFSGREGLGFQRLGFRVSGFRVSGFRVSGFRA